MRQTLAALAVLTGLGTAVLVAQDDRGPGTTPLARRGWEWESNLTLEKEELARIQADLHRKSLAEWKEAALAWVAFEPLRAEGASGLRVPAVHRVAGLEGDRRTEVQAAGGEQGSWEVRFGKKPPRSLTLTLTDVDSTKIDCPGREIAESGGHLGIFVYEGRILCLPRSAKGTG